MRLVIDRKRWMRHSIHGFTPCALGHLLIAVGVEKYGDLLKDWPSIEFDGSPRMHLGHAIIIVNDQWPDGLEREQKLIDLFGKVGIDLEFAG